MSSRPGHKEICRHIVRTKFDANGSCADTLPATALRDYQFFQKGQGQAHFPISDKYINALAKGISELEDMRSTLKRLPSESGDAEALIETAGRSCEEIGRVLLEAMEQADSPVRREQPWIVRPATMGRWLAGMAGGLALVIPMAVMLAYPELYIALITTTFSILVVVTFLAFLVDDLQPKDLFACTAAYAAVLVVFVGNSQSSSDGATGGET